MDPVRLTAAEMVVVAQVGCCRQIRAIERGARERHAAPDPWGVNIEGAAAEYVVANWLHAWWNAITPLNWYGEDVGGNVHVRHTTRADGGLILHPDDPPDGKFVLVVGRLPELRIAGSLTAGRGQVKRYWRTDWPVPAYCVPQTELEVWS